MERRWNLRTLVAVMEGCWVSTVELFEDFPSFLCCDCWGCSFLFLFFKMTFTALQLVKLVIIQWVLLLVSKVPYSASLPYGEVRKLVVFQVCLCLQLPWQSSSLRPWCLGWRFGWRCRTLWWTVFTAWEKRRWIHQVDTKTLLASALMQWSTFLTSLRKDK